MLLFPVESEDKTYCNSSLLTPVYPFYSFCSWQPSQLIVWNQNRRFNIWNNTEIYEVSVPRTKKVSHYAINFEPVEENRITYESSYCSALLFGASIHL